MKRLLALVLALTLLTGCGPRAVVDDRLHILCTTYPVYLFTTAVVGDVQGVEVELLVNTQTSCLHDYTLTVENMKAVDHADILVMSGAGLEDFLADALEQKDIPVIDCSEGLSLLPSLEHEGHGGHDHEEEMDPHYWMDPENAAQAVETIARELAALDNGHAAHYEQTAASAQEALYELTNLQRKRFASIVVPSGGDYLSGAPGFITFHDGFQYFADFSGLELLAAIEEEEGAEASARELKELIELVKGNDIPAIFVEKNGSRRSAEVIARETGCKVYELDLLMSGEGKGIEPYIQAIEYDLATVKEAFG